MDGVNDGYNRVLKAMRLLSISTVFGPVSFDAWQQVCFEIFFVNSLIVSERLMFSTAAVAAWLFWK
jgi:hypothetical protein